jgi:hypothetical protein
MADHVPHSRLMPPAADLLPTSLADKKGVEQREAGTCIALGAGVGVLGAASALTGAALCPICVVVAPGLIGLGIFKGYLSRKAREPVDNG